MKYESYESLAAALALVGLVGNRTRKNQLVVSSQRGNVWPHLSNSFWMAYRDGVWYLGTWAPHYYRVPPDQDVFEMCLACMKSRKTATWVAPKKIVDRFALEHIDWKDFDRLFPPDENEGGESR